MSAAGTVGLVDTPLGPAPARPKVPWWTVVVLAVVMSYADGFWMISLRGSVGAIERSDAPFMSWLRESTLSLPLFVLAVLGALTLALRWFGPAPRGSAVLWTALLTVAAGTLAGVAEIAASAAYDYHLQSSMMVMMNSMRGTCAGGSCLQQMQQASLDMQVRAVGYGSAILLATNLLFVSWAWAFRGGRLDVTRRCRPDHPGAAATRQARGVRTSRVDDLRYLLVAGLVGSAVVHAAVIPEHLDEWGAAGAFFGALTVAELAVAGLIYVRGHTTGLLGAAALSVGPLMLWLYSRTLGLPFGPEPGVPEAVGLADVAACTLELGTLIAAVVLLCRQVRLGSRPPASAHVSWLLTVAVIAVSVIGIAGSSLSWVNVTGDQMIMADSE